MIFSELLGQARDLLNAGTLILLSVDVDKKSEDELRFLAQTIEPLTQAVQNVTSKLNIHIVSGGGEVAGKIKSVLGQAGQGKVKVSVIVAAGTREAEIELPGGWNITETYAKIPAFHRRCRRHQRDLSRRLNCCTAKNIIDIAF